MTDKTGIGDRLLAQLEELVTIGEAIADAYRQNPETDDELVWAAHSTRAMIAEEPW